MAAAQAAGFVTEPLSPSSLPRAVPTEQARVCPGGLLSLQARTDDGTNPSGVGNSWESRSNAGMIPGEPCRRSMAVRGQRHWLAAFV